MEGRFSAGGATVLGAGVAGHACTACANQTKAHHCCDDSAGSQRDGVSAHLLPTLDLPGECDPGLAHPAQFGYQSWVCQRASGELGTSQTSGDLREARRSFAPPGSTEPQATASDG